jgi:hypothetical protein
MKAKTILAAALIGVQASITATSMAQTQSRYEDLASLLRFCRTCIAADQILAQAEAGSFSEAKRKELSHEN